MSIEKVRAYFEGFGIAGRIREFDVSSATVELAAIAVGVEGARIAKSMSFKLGDEPIIVVVAGDQKIDNAKYKAQFHQKAKMLTFDEACAFTGHAPGGVCSFALPENVKTYLDVSLKLRDGVPRCGQQQQRHRDDLRGAGALFLQLLRLGRCLQAQGGLKRGGRPYADPHCQVAAGGQDGVCRRARW